MRLQSFTNYGPDCGTPKDPEESEWRLGSYAQFLREDPPEDSVYDNLR